eukprot:gb/GFBE01022022.1/.p1 GENE.gb/GFBE01022022.1/~~gb/GFBE01022022.1/.p1  ORF type:complete len:509 (+),score=82.24 gb/GFBE01022022.1/:1-1527(+)
MAVAAWLRATRPRPPWRRVRWASTQLCWAAAVVLLLQVPPSWRERTEGFAASPGRSTRSVAVSRSAEGSVAVAEKPAKEDWRNPPGDPSDDQRWALWPALPIAPYERRVTMRYDIIPGELWSFEQKQGILYIHVPIRMTVYRMQSRRGLFVYAPVAPTKECLRLLRELEEQYGEVAYIVLPTVAVEHKYFVGPFSQAFPKAEVWVCPGQFSVPFQLPLQLLGFPGGDRLRILPSPSDTKSGHQMPESWKEEGLDYRILGPIGKDLNNGPFAEVVFYLRRLKTMLVTDLVVSVPAEPPAIVLEEPRALAFHARDNALAPLDASREALIRGWGRVALFALFFQSSAINVEPVSKAIDDASKSEAKDLGWAGLLPWNFRSDWKKSFDALRGPIGGGGLFVAPILSELILNRYLSSDVWPFVEDVTRSWGDMERVVPAHFEAPVNAGAQDWRDAFRRAFGNPPVAEGDVLGSIANFLGPRPGPQPLAADLQYLRNISRSLTEAGITDPPENL